jgi:2,3-bisphosphoglycerate-independent phosphoglycerate mutase
VGRGKAEAVGAKVDIKTEDENAEAEGARKARECGRIVDRDRRIMFKSKPQQLANWAFLRG